MLYYSERWMKSATDAELETEREKVRVAYATAGTTGLSGADFNYLEKLLHRFDQEMSKRAWGGKEYGYPVHREHGWHL